SLTASISPERTRPLPLPDQRIVARISTVFIQFGGSPGHENSFEGGFGEKIAWVHGCRLAR
ncbi:MAG: hypothetical protein WAN65_26145, partial [Candidatus Sulfotelmatobacter sp.]